MTKKIINVDDVDDYLANYASKDRNIKQATAIRGRQRQDQSDFMHKNNPMQGQVSPNRGKSMPHIGEKTRGKKKPEGFGERVSASKKGKPVPKLQGRLRPDHSQAMKDPARNKGAIAMSELHTCPHCGKIANLPNYKRWHGDNCKHR